MARPLDIIVSVRDAASGKLVTINKNLRDTGKAANQANIDFTKFNRILFSATAYLGVFQKAFGGLFSSIEEGATFDNIETQFDKNFGTHGTIRSYIRGFTDTAIDEFEVMKAGVSLSNLGIVTDVSSLANVMAKAGTAAKLAGKDSSVGIQEMTEFMKEGSVAQLEQLDLINKANPAFQAQQAILGKYGGVMSGVISTQYRLALGMELLNLRTKGQLKGHRDLIDTIKDLNANWANSKKEVGAFLGQALKPLLEILNMGLETIKDFAYILKFDKDILFLAKGFILLTSAVAGAAAVFGTLRLASIALTSLGFGLPGILLNIVLLGSAFLGITSSADGFISKLKLLGGFLKGTFQLVESFLDDPVNFAKGIGKMDKSIHDMLEKNGLLKLAELVARVASVIVIFVKDSIAAFASVAKFVDDTFGGIAKRIIAVVSMVSTPWKRFWIDDQETFQKKALRWVVVAGSIFAAFKGLKGLYGLFGGILSKIPVIGKFFGGGSAPKGTANDPIYVRNASGNAMFDSFMSKTEDLVLGDKIGTGFLSKITPFLTTFGTGVALMAAANQATEGLIPTTYDELKKQALGNIANPFAPKNVPIQNNSTNIPVMPENQEDAIDMLGEQMKDMSQQKRQDFESSIESALSNSSPGGNQITPDEWVTIFRTALDTSEKVGKMADKTNSSTVSVPSSRR